MSEPVVEEPVAAVQQATSSEDPLAGAGAAARREEEGAQEVAPLLEELDPEAEEASPLPHFQPGHRVRLCRLHLNFASNGLQGELVAWDESQKRWKVRMQDGTGKMLRPVNLELDAAGSDDQFSPRHPMSTMSPQASQIEPGIRIRAVRLSKQMEMNGMEGAVIAWDEAQSRWKVRMDNGSKKLLKPDNLEVVIFPAGVERQPLGEAEGATPAPREARAASPQNDPVLKHFEPGARIRVSGLQSKPEINGSEGSVIAWDVEQERWKVRLDDGSRKALRPANLEPAVLCGSGGACGSSDPGWQPREGLRVRLFDLQLHAELNGKEGTVVAWVQELGRWQLRMDDGSERMFKSGNLRPCTEVQAPSLVGLALGCRVCVQGLVARSELNGQLGTIVGWDGEQARWRVRMDDGSGKVLRAQHLKPLELPEPCSADLPVAPARETALGPPLQPGRRARLVGLQSRPQLNGQLGTLIEYLEEEDRWRLRLEDGTGKSLRPANLQPVEEEDDAGLLLAELCRLVDRFPQLRPRLGKRLLAEVEAVADRLLSIGSAEPQEGEEADIIRELGGSSLGIIGTRCLLNRLSVGRPPADFSARAEGRVAHASEEETGSHSPGTALLLRDSAAVEFRLWKHAEDPTMELACHEGELQESAPSADCQAPRGPLAPLLLRLSERLLTGGLEPGGGLAGAVLLYTTSTPGFADLIALRRLQVLLPGVSLAFAMRGEPGSVR